MHVVHYIDTLCAGGKERQLVELLKGLTATHGIECELIVMSDKIQYEDLYSLKIPIHFLIRKTKKDSSIFIPISFKLLKEILLPMRTILSLDLSPIRSSLHVE